MKYNYYYDEWSQDTRKYKVESDSPLTRDEIIHMASSCKIVDGSTYSDVDKKIWIIIVHCGWGNLICNSPPQAGKILQHNSPS